MDWWSILRQILRSVCADGYWVIFLLFLSVFLLVFPPYLHCLQLVDQRIMYGFS